MARLTKVLKLILHVSLLSFIHYFIKKQQNIKAVRKVERYMPDIKHLLMWTRVPGIEEEGQEYFIKKNCMHINCYITTNRSLLDDIRFFDTIIFNVQDVSSQKTDLPKLRSPVQKYVFAANDSADNYPMCDPFYDDYFNWTWTYKQDSSIPYSFISVFTIQDEELGNNVHWNYQMNPITNRFKTTLGSKSQAAAVFLDKCITTSKREYFLANLKEELKKYNLTVDVFGACGNMKCGRKSMNSCFYRIRRIYYFYLALEDSIAADYITRNVLYAYNNNAVPVVLGGAQYTKFLPPYSYLDATALGEDMIAKVMNDAIKNKEKYYEFFKWRNHYTFKESPVLDGCTLCTFMNNQDWLENRVNYEKFRLWWNPYYNDRCQVGNRYNTVL